MQAKVMRFPTIRYYFTYRDAAGLLQCGNFHKTQEAVAAEACAMTNGKVPGMYNDLTFFEIDLAEGGVA